MISVNELKELCENQTIKENEEEKVLINCEDDKESRFDGVFCLFTDEGEEIAYYRRD